MIAQDFLLNSTTGDILIANGDFVVGPSDQQHIADILISFPGWWKQYPQVGVGIISYLKSSGQNAVLTRSIKLQLTADGYTTNPTVYFNSSSSLTIYPNASRS